MRHRNGPSLLPYFFLATFAVLFGDALYPGIKLAFYAPLIVTCYYRLPFTLCLWVSFSCGLVLDLLSSSQMFGMHALNYCFSTVLIYARKQNFYDDSISTLPVLTAFFSVTSTLLQLLFQYSLGLSFAITLKWIVTDVILMTLVDSVYAFSCFTLPFILLNLRPKRHRSFSLKRPH
ncbi:MAG: rod shape-determining protein MreD [Chlamydiales bacterium]|jgi:rod shape-determining protein MreD